MSNEEARGCYQCGSREGNPIRLCRDCTEERLQRVRRARDAGAKGLPNLWISEDFSVVRSGPTGRSAYARNVALLFLSLALIGAVGYLMLFSNFGPMYALDRAERAFQMCRSQLLETPKQTTSYRLISGAPLTTELDRDMESMMAQGVHVAVNRLCIKLRDECRHNSSGQTCSQFMSAMRERQSRSELGN